MSYQKAFESLFPSTTTTSSSSVSTIKYLKSKHDSSVINYNTGNNNVVYLNTSLTLTPGTWMISYNITLSLYANYTTIVFLSSSNPSDTNSNILINRLSESQTCHRTNNTSTTTQDFRCVYWNTIINVTTETTYYLYGTCTTSLSTTQKIFDISTTGYTNDPDNSIILSAILLG
jgi:hypothetical protein